MTPLTVAEALTLPCPFCKVEAGKSCRSITGQGSGPPDEMHYTRRAQPLPDKLSEFHVGDGLFFARKPDGSVVVRARGMHVLDGTPEREWVVEEGSWLSVMCQMSARGEVPETLGEAREFHRMQYIYTKETPR